MSPQGLSGARCALHPGREAAARCPGCGKDHCRECVVEHEGRLLCTSCLTREALTGDEQPRRRLAPLLRPLATAAGLFWTWLVFFALAELLCRLPDAAQLGSGFLP